MDKLPNELVNTPKQIRNRLRRAARTGNKARIKRDIALYSEMTGFKPVSEWDMEELARGKPRNAAGDFRGVKPSWINDDISREINRRFKAEIMQEINVHALKAIEAIINLINNEEVDDKGRPIVDAKTKLAANIFIIEHVIGKPKAEIDIKAKDATKQILASAIVLDDGQPQDAPIILEGEFEEDDEE